MSEQVTDTQATDTQEKTATEPKLDFAQVVQKQITELKEEFVQRVESLKAQFPLSQEDLISLKDKLAAEISAILEDVTKVSKEIKQDITEISVKHKDQLAGTLSHAKETVVDAVKSINLSQPKDAKEDQDKEEQAKDA